MKSISFYLIACICFAMPLLAQESEKSYVPEKDLLVQAKLVQWQDYKFGLLMTWGTYSQWGIVESWGKKNRYNQDIDMPRIAEMARRHQPGLIVVDRWVNGSYENYLTPENKVPEKALSVPWESCITMATSWSYVKTDQYKSVRQLIHLLVDVVAKGGNLLLNIGPSPEGEWSPDAYDRLKGIASRKRLGHQNLEREAAVILRSSPGLPKV